MYNDMLSFELEQKRKSYQSQEKEICKDCKDRAGLPCLFVFSCEKLKQTNEERSSENEND